MATAAKQETPFAASAAPTHPSLVRKFAGQYSIEPDKLLPILKATAFKQEKGEVSNEQMAALLAVADRYHLDPFTREIFAFSDRYKGIVPIVSLDGWSRIINDHEQSDGFEFRVSDAITTPPGGKECPVWMEVIIYRKDRKHPIVVREYLDEVYRERGKRQDGSEFGTPWQTHTKRMLRHKTLIQGARIAYGFSGIYDEDEAERIIEGEVVTQVKQISATGAEGLRQAAEAKAAKREEPTPISVLGDVKRVCEKALGIAEADVALLSLDDAKDLARVLSGVQKEEADQCIADTQAALDAKFISGDKGKAKK
jgi:phage recombination protein Bet